MRTLRTTTTLAAALALTLGSCASSGGGDGTPVSTLSQLDESKLKVSSGKGEAKIGYVLASLDRQLKNWILEVSEAKSTKDVDKVLGLESNIRREVLKNEEDIIDQLLSGPPSNRTVAAAALGFSRSPEALSPLLAALTDGEEQVVSNALLSIAQLGDPNTPVESIATLAQDSAAPMVRNNAMRALRSTALRELSSQEREAALGAARSGLFDESAPVRVTALILMVDLRAYESIDSVAGLLGDANPLVASAASAATAKMGELEPEVKGKAARALTAGLLKLDSESLRKTVLRNLQQLSGKNYGEDTEEWIAWANRMP